MSERSSDTAVGPGSGARSVWQWQVWPRTVRRVLFPWWLGRSGAGRIRATIGAMALPSEIKAVVETTVRRTRLWPEERLDVAHELGGHFADGLEAGRTSVDLVRDFGDPEKAARLIRSSKIAGRPWWWKSMRWTVRGVAAVLLVAVVSYAYLAGRYYLGSPTIRHNYMAELNTSITAGPEDEKAWPLYIRAVRELGPWPAWHKHDWPNSPKDEHWDEAVAFLHEHAAALATIRAAAGRPRLGYVLSNVTDAAYARALETRSTGYRYDPTLEKPEENPMLIGVLLPYLGEMRSDARLLRLDAQDAAERGDGARFCADVGAMLGMVDQCCERRFVIDTLVGAAILGLASETVLEDAGRPGLLDGRRAAELAHRFSATAGGRIRFDLTAERMSFDDILQRFYSDNGAGDGHPIKGELDRVYSDFGVVGPNRLAADVARPVFGAAAPSRRELEERYARWMARAMEDEALPSWRHDERSAGQEYRELYRSFGPALSFIDSLMGGEESGFASYFASRDTAEGLRSAALAALAMEAFRVEHGVYPATLADLTPRFLPVVPPDPFDGRPMRYRLIGDGSAAQPVLYSVGVDQVDDGGTGPADPKVRDKTHAWRGLAYFRGKRQADPRDTRDVAGAKGDWVFYTGGSQGGAPEKP